MPNKKYKITRKGIYGFFLLLNTIVSLIRISLFPDQNWVFHGSIFVVSSIAILLAWEMMLVLGRWLGRLTENYGGPYLQIVLQTFITYLVAFTIAETIFNNAADIFKVEVPPLLHVVAQLLYVLMSILMNLVYFSTNYFNEWVENSLRAERLQKEQAQMRYDALRNQLNPHFLFNALTSLNSLIFENQELASQFLQQLSKIYRYVLQHKDKESVTLAVEIDFIRNFITLLNIRFEKSLYITLDIDESDMEKGIVPVTLQTLIQNAIKHNVLNDQKPLRISIRTSDGYLVISNNLQKKNVVETSNKLGLANLKNLYAFLSEKPVEVTEDGLKFEVKIPLLK